VSIPIRGDKLFAGFAFKYHGSVRTLRGNRADDFSTANLTFTRRGSSGFELSGTISNLFDATYAYPGGEDHLQDVIEQDGRAVNGKLSYRF
jgi:iron complex outermembrane receptor protein